MGDESSINPTNKKIIIDWLNKHWLGAKTCNICGHNNWSISDHVVAPLISHAGGINIGGPTYPNVLVICNNCGNTHFFNWALIEKATRPDRPEEKSDG